LGDGFSRAFGISYQGKSGREETPHYTSWGISTRMIGGLVMMHGDDKGLVLPPYVAPVQVIVVPIMQHKDGVLKSARALVKKISRIARVQIDETDNTPGWKFSEHEMRGVPVRIELGPRDIDAGTCVVARRDNGAKEIIKIDEISRKLPEIFKQIHSDMYARALKRQEEMTYDANTYDEIIKIANEKPGYIRAHWCGDAACEEKLKKEHGITIRCIIKERGTDCAGKCDCVCAVSGKTAKYKVIWAKAY